MTAKQRFQEAVRSCVDQGTYPGPLQISRERSKLFHEGLRARRMLNGREITWRAEVLTELGWTRHLFCKDREAYELGEFTWDEIRQKWPRWPRRRWLPPPYWREHDPRLAGGSRNG